MRLVITYGYLLLSATLDIPRQNRKHDI